MIKVYEDSDGRTDIWQRVGPQADWTRIGDGPSRESALILAEVRLRTDLDDIQQRLTEARQRVKAAGSPSY